MTIVVPMPRDSLCRCPSCLMRLSAATTASFMNFSMVNLDAVTSGVMRSGANHSFTVAMAISEATSPAFMPPMPSATTSNAPFSPNSHSSLLIHLICAEHRSDAAWKLSSLLVLTRPTLVLAAILNVILPILYLFLVFTFLGRTVMATSGGPTTVRRITTTARHGPGSGLSVSPYGRLIAYGMRQL